MSWHSFLFECQYAVALVVRCGDRYLVSFRKKCKCFSGKWQFIGGNIEDESAAEAIVREAYEEAGVTIDPKLVKPVGLSVIRSDEVQVSCQFFLLDLPITNAYDFTDKEPEKHSPWEWVQEDELLRRELMPGMRDIILKFKNERRN